MAEQTTAADTSAAAPSPSQTPVPAPPAASPPSASPAPPSSSAERPDYLPETYWDGEKKAPKLDALAGDLKKLTEAQQADADRKAALPKEPGEYKVELPDGYKLPEGFHVDEKSPAWGKFAQFAHAEGLTQEQFSKASALYMDIQAAEATQRLAAAHQEFAKLGDGGKVVVEGVHKFIDANASSPEAAAAIKESCVKADMVSFLSKIASTMVANGITSFNGSGRDDGRRADGKPQNWDTMSSIDRLTWVRSNQGAA